MSSVLIELPDKGLIIIMGLSHRLNKKILFTNFFGKFTQQM